MTEAMTAEMRERPLVISKLNMLILQTDKQDRQDTAPKYKKKRQKATGRNKLILYLNKELPPTESKSALKAHIARSMPELKTLKKQNNEPQTEKSGNQLADRSAHPLVHSQQLC